MKKILNQNKFPKTSFSQICKKQIKRTFLSYFMLLYASKNLDVVRKVVLFITTAKSNPSVNSESDPNGFDQLFYEIDKLFEKHDPELFLIGVGDDVDKEELVAMNPFYPQNIYMFNDSIEFFSHMDSISHKICSAHLKLLFKKNYVIELSDFDVRYFKFDVRYLENKTLRLTVEKTYDPEASGYVAIFYSLYSQTNKFEHDICNDLKRESRLDEPIKIGASIPKENHYLFITLATCKTPSKVQMKITFFN